MSHREMFALVAVAALGALGMRSARHTISAGASPLDSLASPAGPGSAEPNLTVAPDGRVYLTWLEPADSGHALRFAVHDGTRWSAGRMRCSTGGTGDGSTGSTSSPSGTVKFLQIFN